MPRASRTRHKWVSTLLILAGLFGIGFYGWFLIEGELFQKKASREFDELSRSLPKPKTAPILPRPAAGSVIGRLVIPRLNLRAMVREGTDEHILDVALGHVSGTALPGTPGNVAVAGHRDRLFRCLRNIARDDQIIFETTYGDYTYQVQDTTIVKPSDTEVLAPGKHDEITLVTCYPFYYVGSAPSRFIVHARLLSTQVAGSKPDLRPANNSPVGAASNQPQHTSQPKNLVARRAKPAAHHPWYVAPDSY